MKIERAQVTDAKDLTGLTIRSKSYWNYSSTQIEEWKDDLTISADYINMSEVYKLTKANQLIGYYSYLELDCKRIKLDNIFVEPEFIGRGYGRLMMNHFFQQVSDLPFNTIELDSEPNAENFYQKLGFAVVGQIESSIENRFLLKMELKIKPDHNSEYIEYDTQKNPHMRCGERSALPCQPLMLSARNKWCKK